MDSTTQTLLIVLITLLSVIIIVALICITVIVISLRRLLDKVHTIADSSGQSLDLLKQQLARKATVLGVLRYVMKKKGR